MENGGKCLLCGKEFTGRVDKKFCSDACRSEYHNRIRLGQRKNSGIIERILRGNCDFLRRNVLEGKRVISLDRPGTSPFNRNFFTSCERRFLRPPIYHCFGYRYYISLGKIHIIDASD